MKPNLLFSKYLNLSSSSGMKVLCVILQNTDISETLTNISYSSVVLLVLLADPNHIN